MKHFNHMRSEEIMTKVATICGGKKKKQYVNSLLEKFRELEPVVIWNIPNVDI